LSDESSQLNIRLNTTLSEFSVTNYDLNNYKVAWVFSIIKYGSWIAVSVKSVEEKLGRVDAGDKKRSEISTQPQ
jgi:hypothetical protein